jgi:hypothetical protein
MRSLANNIVRAIIIFAFALHGANSHAENTAATAPEASSATGARLLSSHWRCTRPCEPFKPSPAFPTTDPRHGLMLSYGGISGTTLYRVDFDSGQLLLLERTSEAMATERREVTLGDGQLATLRRYADRIWALPAQLPSERVGLDGGWAIRLSDDGVMRVESGLGSPGSAGHDLAVEIGEIEQALSPESTVVVDFRRYRMSACYLYAEPGHVTTPAFKVRLMNAGSEDIAPTFPARTAGAQVHYSGVWQSCSS